MNLLGWYGVLAILLAYFLNSFWNYGADSSSTLEKFIYQILNFTGAIGVVLVSLRKKAWQPAVLNAIWAVIALMALLRKPA